MKDKLSLRIKLGDEQDFELLFRKYYVRLCGFGNKFLNNPEEAQEVVQEVFTRILEVREDIDPEESLKAYLFKISQNRVRVFAGLAKVPEEKQMMQIAK